MNKKVSMKQLKEELIKRHGNVCAYCGRIMDSDSLMLDHFYPIYIYPEKDNIDNLVLCCRNCNSLKGAKSPDDYGLLFPYSKEYELEIQENSDGILEGSTDRAIRTIELLSLNRPDLVEYRFNRIAENYKFNKIKSPKEIYDESIDQVQRMLNLTDFENDSIDYLNKLLFANVIASLEAYMNIPPLVEPGVRRKRATIPFQIEPSFR